jgi:hypothetical protein
MSAIIDRLSSEQLTLAILALIGGVVAIVAIIAFAKQLLQTITHQAALDREKQASDIEIRNKIIDQAIASGAGLEALLAAEKKLDALLAAEKNPSQPVSNADNLDGQLAVCLAKLETAPEEIEQTLSRALLLDPDRKKAVVSAIVDLFDEGAAHESILAAVRGFCASSKSKATDAELPVAVPAG